MVRNLNLSPIFLGLRNDIILHQRRVWGCGWGEGVTVRNLNLSPIFSGLVSIS